MNAATTTEMTTTDPMATVLEGLEPGSAMTLRSAFVTMFAQADRWMASARSIQVTSVDDKREMKLARESRLALREIRVNAEKTRKRLKEDSVRQGKAIDGMANVLKALIEPIEEHLHQLETFSERAEQARKDALRGARTAGIEAYGGDPSAYVNLGEMSDETWSLTITTVREAHEARVEAAKHAEAVRLEAERIAIAKREEERVAAAKAEAERVERERVQAAENERLKAEAAEREAAAKVEREAAAAENARVEGEARAAREAAEKAMAEVEAERHATRRARAAEAARVEAAAKAEQDRAAADEAARVAAELAPDREKLALFAGRIRGLALPALTTKRGQAAGAKVAEQLTKMAAWIEKTGASL